MGRGGLLHRSFTRLYIIRILSQIVTTFATFFILIKLKNRKWTLYKKLIPTYLGEDKRNQNTKHMEQKPRMGIENILIETKFFR